MQMICEALSAANMAWDNLDEFICPDLSSDCCLLEAHEDSKWSYPTRGYLHLCWVGEFQLSLVSQHQTSGLICVMGPEAQGARRQKSHKAEHRNRRIGLHKSLRQSSLRPVVLSWAWLCRKQEDPLVHMKGVQGSGDWADCRICSRIHWDLQ